MANTNAASRVDPFRNYLFRVEIDGIQTAAFSEATIPNSTTDSVEYREGTDPNYSRKLGGLTKFGDLTLKKGLTVSLELYNWYQLIENSGPDASGGRKNISLMLMDSSGNITARWNILNAWPTGYEASGMNASGNEVEVETFTITLEKMERVQV